MSLIHPGPAEWHAVHDPSHAVRPAIVHQLPEGLALEDHLGVKNNNIGTTYNIFTMYDI